MIALTHVQYGQYVEQMEMIEPQIENVLLASRQVRTSEGVKCLLSLALGRACILRACSIPLTSAIRPPSCCLPIPDRG